MLRGTRPRPCHASPRTNWPGGSASSGSSSVGSRGPCDRRRIGRHAELSEDASDRLTLGDDSEHAKPTLALRALEHIHVERSPQQARPVDGRVERATDEPVPVAHREHVRREGDDVTPGRATTPAACVRVAAPSVGRAGTAASRRRSARCGAASASLSTLGSAHGLLVPSPDVSPAASSHAGRRSAQVPQLTASLMAFTGRACTALRSEEIKKALGLDRREVPRILKTAVAAKNLTAKGQKRATTYTAA
jgi:hypothetical protein